MKTHFMILTTLVQRRDHQQLNQVQGQRLGYLQSRLHEILVRQRNYMKIKQNIRPQGE